MHRLIYEIEHNMIIIAQDIKDFQGVNNARPAPYFRSLGSVQCTCK